MFTLCFDFCLLVVVFLNLANLDACGTSFQVVFFFFFFISSPSIFMLISPKSATYQGGKKTSFPINSLSESHWANLIP